MDSFIGILVIIGIIGSAVSKTTTYCPPEEDLSSCFCKHGLFYGGFGTQVYCGSMNDSQAFYNDVQKLRGYTVDYFFLGDSTFTHLPAGLFSGTTVKRIKITNSSLENHYSFKNPNDLSPFDGLENSLEEIKIEMCSNPSSWFLTEMKNLTGLKTFGIEASPINFVGHFFDEIVSLENIAVTYGNVNRIHPQAFPELKNLKMADFTGNNIPYLVRTMFSNPAPKLKVLKFSANKLFTLNENMFENMPALRFLDISQNEFKNFENAVFKPVWNQLTGFYTAFNPFRCDCSLIPLQQDFITGSCPPGQDLQFVTCKNPGDRNETRLVDLDGKSMHC